MPEGTTVANTSCLIGLSAIDHLWILEKLYQKVLLPSAVAGEWQRSLLNRVKSK